MSPRSVLFQDRDRPPVLPVCEHIAGNEKFIRKAFALQAERGPVFDITCDLEDGAPVGREAEHARMTSELIASGDNRFAAAGLRIHDPSSPHWRRDLEIAVPIAGTRLRYVTVPKVRSAADVRMVRTWMETRFRAAGIERIPPLHVLIETHAALEQVREIAALPNVEVLDFGLLDFISGHLGAIGSDAMESPGQFEHALVRRAKCEVVAAALAHGAVPSHNITVHFNDPARVEADARRARREFGFLRMWSIHPAQIEPIIAGMRPAADEIDEARRIIELAAGAGFGPIRHGEKLHDRASFRYYFSLLEQAAASGVELESRIKELLK